MKKDKLQSDVWDGFDNCKRLQKRFGDYDEFEINGGNIENKKPIFKLMNDLCVKHNDSLGLFEVGCGPGHFLWSFRNKVSEIVGLDYSKHMLDLAKEQFSKVKVKSKFVQGNCWDIPFQDGYMDIVLQVDVCMHIGGSYEALKEMMRVSKKYIVFTGPGFEQFNDVMDKELVGMSWAVSIPLLEIELNRLINDGSIKKYWYVDRPRTSVYAHRILVIEK